MRFYRPHSFFVLLLTGFVFVSLPLFTALFSSVKILDGLVEQSAVAVFRSVERLSDSRKVAALLNDQERSARRYNVLGESAALAEVNASLADLEVVILRLADLSMGKEAKKAVVKGSGLGLAISKEYVQAHGGTLRLLPVKQGACFAVALPLSG